MNKIIIGSILFFMGISHGARAEIVNTTLLVDNMTCIACPYIVRQVLKSVDGVQGVIVDKKNKTAAIMFDDSKTNIDALTRATGDAGYPSKVKSK